MATRKVVPRGDGEGGIGTNLKKWASGYFYALVTKAIQVTLFTTAGFLKNDVLGVITGGNSIAAGDLPVGIDALKVGGGVVNNDEFGRLDGVTDLIQSQLNLKVSDGVGGGTPGSLAKFTAAHVIGDANADDLPSGINANKIGAGIVSSTEYGYLQGAESNIQAQINAIKAFIGM